MGSGNTALKNHFIQFFKACGLYVAHSDFEHPAEYAADLYIISSFAGADYNVWVGKFEMFDSYCKLSRHTDDFTDLDAAVSYSDPDYADKLLLSVANCSDYAEMLFRNMGTTKCHV